MDVLFVFSMLLYLNGAAEGVGGGQTRLFSRAEPPQELDVTPVDPAAAPPDPPVKGSALFFRHGFGPTSVLHKGCQVHGSVPKYGV